MASAVAQMASAGPDALMTLVAGIGPAPNSQFGDQLQSLDEQLGHGGTAQLLSELSNPRSIMRTFLGRQLQASGLDLGELDAKLSEATQSLKSASDEQLEDTGLRQLDRAIEAGIIAIHPVEIDDELAGYRTQLESFLNAPNAYPVFDEKLGQLVASMVNAGAITAAPRALSRGTQTATADRLLANLPTFPGATIDEVLDIRDLLRPPLVRFRAEMIKVTAELRLNALDADFDEAAVELWYGRVAPELEALDELVSSNRLTQTYGATGVKVGGPAVASTLVVGLTSGSWTAAALGGLVGVAGGAFARAAEARAEARSREQGSPYYFLHAANRSLGP